MRIFPRLILAPLFALASALVVARVGGLQAFPADSSQIWYRCMRKGGICRMTEGEASHVDRRQCGVRFGPFIA